MRSFDVAFFDGLPGVFYDSLPDGWGRLLLYRQLRSQGILPQQLSALDRLSYVGHSGMGALVYEPEYAGQTGADMLSIDRLADQSQKVLAGQDCEALEELIALNGSSAGARPKILIGLDASLNKKSIKTIIDQTKEALGNWQTLAKTYNVSPMNRKLVATRINSF